MARGGVQGMGSRSTPWFRERCCEEDRVDLPRPRHRRASSEAPSGRPLRARAARGSGRHALAALVAHGATKRGGTSSGAVPDEPLAPSRRRVARGANVEPRARRSVKDYSPRRRTAVVFDRKWDRRRLPRGRRARPRRVRGEDRPRGGVRGGHGGGCARRGGRGRRVSTSPAASGTSVSFASLYRLRPAAATAVALLAASFGVFLLPIVLAAAGRPALSPGADRRPGRARRPARLMARLSPLPDALAAPYLATLAIPIFALSHPGRRVRGLRRLRPRPPPLRRGLRDACSTRGPASTPPAAGAVGDRPRGRPRERSRRRDADAGRALRRRSSPRTWASPGSGS